MFKQSIMWAFICATAHITCAHTLSESDSTHSDTIEYSIPPQFLNEITVTASPVINKTDRKIIRPDRETVGSSTNGIDILRKLKPPRITVNPLTNEITLAGGGEVMLCINGVEATSAQISAIRPGDILRIEYHTNPGGRYYGADAVIDYITSRHDSGGSLILDTFGAIASGRYATIDNFAVQYDRGHSAWNMNIGFMGQRKDKWIRDYEESWNYPTGSVDRKERGLPVSVGGNGTESIVNYNYAHPRGDMIDIKLGLDFNDVPNKEQGDRHAILDTSASENSVTVAEHTEENSIRPNAGLYYLRRIGESNKLILNLQGSYLHSRMKHEYSENGIGESTRVNGKKYTTKFSGLYEHRAGSRVWSTGITDNNSFLHNVYCLSEPVKIDISQGQTALIGEYSDKFGNWGAVLKVRGVYNRQRQDKRTINKFYVLPGANISFRPGDKYFLKYAVSVDYIMPSAAEISAVAQPVQDGMIRRGNPSLDPFRVIEQSFTASFDSRFISIEANVEYCHEHKPIMESVIFENDTFVRTYFNQRSFQRVKTCVSLTARVWERHLSISAEPILSHYISRGRDYHHCHNIFRIGWNVDFSYRNWLAYANIMSGPENKMYGEEIIEEKDMNQIMAGYKRDKWSIHLGVFNAFMHNYWMETRNLSALTPYRSKAHSGRSSSYVAVRFTLSLDFGRKGRALKTPEMDNDIDNGILTGTK